MSVSLKKFTRPSSLLVDSLVQRPKMQAKELQSVIDGVFERVRDEGDQAILDFTVRFDGVSLTSLVVSDEEKEKAIDRIPQSLMEAIDTAYTNITAFHQSQIIPSRRIETSAGVECWQEMRAIDKVGLYIPGGTAPLFSTVLMLGVPAKVAGCSEVVLCTPPQKEGTVHDAVIYAAEKCGIKKIIKAGGAQAVAAMVFGTDTVPAVYKIFGPGNQYVTAAKMRALDYGVALDLPAGPSEVLVYADQTSEPRYVAADLLSQAEHGKDSQVVLVTTHDPLVKQVEEELEDQLAQLPRRDIAIASLQHGYAVVYKDPESAFKFINEYAPEHFIISSDFADDYLPLIKNAGSVFVGHLTPESAGDYASGTNHTLPTAAYAKSYSGVSLDSFIKKITFQKISEHGLRNLGPTVITMARNELLDGHASAVQIRLDDLEEEE